MTFSRYGGHGALAGGPYHLNPEVLRPRLADISVMNPAFLEQPFRRMGDAGEAPTGDASSSIHASPGLPAFLTL